MILFIFLYFKIKIPCKKGGKKIPYLKNHKIDKLLGILYVLRFWSSIPPSTSSKWHMRCPLNAICYQCLTKVKQRG